MSCHRKALLDYSRDPVRAQVMEFDPEGIALFKQIFVEPFTYGWQRLTTWFSDLHNHRLK